MRQASLAVILAIKRKMTNVMMLAVGIMVGKVGFKIHWLRLVWHERWWL